MKLIEDLGDHKDRKGGEILIGFISETMFLASDYWKTKRLGIGRLLTKYNYGKRPFFIEKQEAIEKGWEVR